MSDVLKIMHRLYLINSNFSIWKYHKVSVDDPLVILKESDLIKNSANVVVGTHFAEAAVAAAATNATPDDIYLKIYELATEELETTGKIKGFEVLNLNTFDRLWLSHYDIKFL